MTESRFIDTIASCRTHVLGASSWRHGCRRIDPIEHESDRQALLGEDSLRIGRADVKPRIAGHSPEPLEAGVDRQTEVRHPVELPKGRPRFPVEERGAEAQARGVAV